MDVNDDNIERGIDPTLADIYEALLVSGNLSGAYLSGTDLNGAILPDGSIHD